MLRGFCVTKLVLGDGLSITGELAGLGSFDRCKSLARSRSLTTASTNSLAWLAIRSKLYLSAETERCGATRPIDDCGCLPLGDDAIDEEEGTR